MDPTLICHVCGLEWPPAFSDPDPGWRVPVGGAAMWAQVRKRYDTDKVHRAFIAFCDRAGALDYAARRYRRIIDLNGPEDEVAACGLARIQTVAFERLQPRQRRGLFGVVVRWALAGLVLLLVAAGTAWALSALGLLS